MSVIETYRVEPVGSAAYTKEVYETANTSNNTINATSYYAREGQVFKFEVENSDNFYVQIGTPASPQREQVVELGNGTNYITAEVEGPIFFSNQSMSQAAKVTMTAPDDVSEIPYLRLNHTTQADFMEQLEEFDDVPNIIWESNNTIVVFNRDLLLDDFPRQKLTVDDYMDNAVANLRLLDNQIHAEDQLANFTDKSDFFHTNSHSPGKSLFAQKNNNAMGAGGDGIGFNGNIGVPSIANAVEHERGWGQIHEAGHQHQQSTWSMNGEANPNIYGYHAGIALGKGPNFTLSLTRPDVVLFSSADSYWENFYIKYEDENYSEDFTLMDIRAGTEDEGGIFDSGRFAYDAQLGQLYSAFGPGFYQKVHHHYSLFSDEKTETFTNLPGRREDFDLYVEKLQNRHDEFAYAASKASGYNLLEYFDTWRFPIRDEVRADIEALGLKELDFDLANFSMKNSESDADMLKLDWVDGPTDLPMVDKVHHGQYVTRGELPEIRQFTTRDGLPNPDSVIEYDPSKIASVEFLNGGEDTNIDYGRANVEILLTGKNGEQNVVVVDMLVMPEGWEDVKTKEDIYDKVLEFYEGGVDASVVSKEEWNMHLDMLNSSGADNSAWLMQAIRNEWMESYEQRQEAIEIIDNLGPEDIEIIDGKVGIWVPNEPGFSLYDFKIDGRTPRTEFLDINPAVDPETGMKFIAYNFEDDPWLNGNAEKGRVLIEDTKIDIYFKLGGLENGDNYGGDALVQTTFGQVWDGSPVTAENLDETINHDDVIMLNQNDIQLRIHRDLYEEMKRDGDFEIEIVTRNEVIGTVTDSGASGNAELSRDDDYYYITSTGLHFYGWQDVHYNGTYTSKVNEDYSGAFNTTLDVQTLGFYHEGTRGADAITGTNRSEAILTRGGEDTVAAGYGNDSVRAGHDSDVVYGSAGLDTIHGQHGADALHGGEDADLLYGGGQDDTIFGDEGEDAIYGDWGHDSIMGGEGEDAIYGGAGHDSILGGEGNDRIEGGSQYDVIDAGSGNDIVYGGSGRDVVDLGYGNDTYIDESQNGYHGADYVEGGGGNDRINTGGGKDTIFGGDGQDTIWGVDGDDNIDAGRGDDNVYGGTGRDTVDLGGGNDTYKDTGGDADYVMGSYGDDQINTAGGDDTIDGGAGNDIIDAGGQADLISAGSGHDIVHGGAGRDTVDLGGGNDVYTDVEQGDRWGEDIVFGGDGNDILNAGGGNDTISGGEGEDIFVISENNGKDVILDFNAEEDHIVFDNVAGFSNYNDVMVAARFVETEDSKLVIIDIDDKNSIELEDVDLEDLKEDDFDFI